MLCVVCVMTLIILCADIGTHNIIKRVNLVV
jgi:preprotein translocase subunit SecE